VSGVLKWAEVHLDRLSFNYHQVKKLAGTKEIIAIVKANAYGHGSKEIARFLEEKAGISIFGVATVEEGIELRESGIKGEILVMASDSSDWVKEIKAFALTPVVWNFETLKVLKDAGIPFEVKVDTGMGRLGFLKSEWSKLLAELPGARLKGVMTHFCCAEDDPEFTRFQYESFLEIVRALRKVFKKIRVHCDNSASLRFRFSKLLTHCRVGLALYGSKPTADYPVELKQVMEVKAKLISVKKLPANFPVSYGASYRTSAEEVVGVVAFGYADGYPRNLSGKGYVFINGRKAPLRGRVCMDMMVVSLEGCNANVGNEVLITGSGIGFEELSKLAGTIPYEIMCRISSRVKRIYVREQER